MSQPENFWKNFFKNTTLLILFNLLFSGWFGKVVQQNYILAAVYFITTVVLLLFVTKKKGEFDLRNTVILIIFFLALLFLQIKSTNLINAYTFTPSQLDQRIQRMNYYPPNQARLGYILENKKEIKLGEKFIENFIEVVDVNTYFPFYFSRLILPFSLICFYSLIKSSLLKKIILGNKVLIAFFLAAISVQSLLGTHGEYGPFLIFPFISASAFEGLRKIMTVIMR